MARRPCTSSYCCGVMKRISELVSTSALTEVPTTFWRAGLVVDPGRMQQNIDALRGLVFSERLARRLMQTMDRASAMSLVDDWCATAVGEGRHLREVAAAGQARTLREHSYKERMKELVAILTNYLRA